MWRIMIFPLACLFLAGRRGGAAVPERPDTALAEPAWTKSGALLAEYTFADARNPGADASGHGYAATLLGRPKVRRVEGVPVLELDGKSGLVLPAALTARLGRGVSIEFRLRFRQVRGGTNILTCNDFLLLRQDPGEEGGKLSFFVFSKGSWEPRLRTFAPKPGRWIHLAISWAILGDGLAMRVFAGSRFFMQRRIGRIPEPPKETLVIGAPSSWAPHGLVGEIAGVRISEQPLREGRLLARMLGLTTAAGDRARGKERAAAENVILRKQPNLPANESGRRRELAGGGLDYRFETGACGWRSSTGKVPETGPAGIAIEAAPDRWLLSPRLNLPVSGMRWLELDAQVPADAVPAVLFVAARGVRAVPFQPAADGGFHVYSIPVDAYPEWDGRLRRLAVGFLRGRGELRLWRLAAGAGQPDWPDLRLIRFAPVSAFVRAKRRVRIEAEVENRGVADLPGIPFSLRLPPGARMISGEQGGKSAPVAAGDRENLSWTLAFPHSGKFPLKLRLLPPGGPPLAASFAVQVHPPRPVHRMHYPPRPNPIDTGDVLVGAQYCPLWRQGTRTTGWERIVPWPNRKPVLGWYDEGSPEVADWEISWCLDHGISFFMYCWYRNGQGRPVTPEDVRLEHAIRLGLFHAKYRRFFKFAVMWENAWRGVGGVSSRKDLLQNLFPYWLANFFTRPEYLCVDRKPLLFIYRPEYVVRDLGSVRAVRESFNQMRAACRKAGFAGLWIIGEYRGLDPKRLRLLRDLGCDAVFAYCWPFPGHPASSDAVEQQIRLWQTRRRLHILPEVLTVSMGWDARPWHASPSRWRLTPADFARACAAARKEMARWPKGSLSRRLLLLDNWNEFGEGHYIAPHRQYGFGYLDAVRTLFSKRPAEDADLTPEDVGLGPYEHLFRQWLATRSRLRRLRLRQPAWGKSNRSDPALMAWWSFDEPQGTPVALDGSGRRHGGILHHIRRTPGFSGLALECRGGSVLVPNTPRLDSGTLTVFCRVRTRIAGQNDRWILNRITGSAPDAGYRLGLSHGRPCWAVPLTPWSHHLIAPKKLPLGRWVALAGTCDGRTIRLFMDGLQVAVMPRPGPVRKTSAPLVLGNFAVDHRAYFQGELDDVRIWDRALSADEIREITQSPKPSVRSAIHPPSSRAGRAEKAGKKSGPVQSKAGQYKPDPMNHQQIRK